ncbi:cytochrome c oxidase assembly factor 5-like [Haliotis rubra]|uniref:cytochrome c oxidase assembly factor 5-like n=1 Tax=Haliotis rubra TaxID=36100 RepID=UPI001EE62283|nr:cytochrome c oxidase assembly factor 5-like [Haliotis rubra]
MPKYYPEEEGEEPKPKTACSGIREDLLDCLLKSDCVMKDGKTPRECLQLGHHPSIPNKCHNLRTAFFECKRSILDMRSRFRGRKGY